MTGAIENLATAAITITAGLLAVVALRAWTHTRSRKVLLVAVAFLVFFLKALVLSAALFTTGRWGEEFLPVSVVADLLVLLLFYAAILRPRSR